MINRIEGAIGSVCWKQVEREGRCIHDAHPHTRALAAVAHGAFQFHHILTNPLSRACMYEPCTVVVASFSLDNE